METTVEQESFVQEKISLINNKVNNKPHVYYEVSHQEPR